MKSILPILALLSIPVLASADSVAWSTYCDGGIEKVRCTVVLNMPGAQFDYPDAYASVSAYNNEMCEQNSFCSAYSDDEPVALGNGDFEFTFQGWLRSCLTVENPSLYGIVFYYTVELGQEPIRRFNEITCNAFEPSPIVDDVECHTLPVASRTWGAIKALYR